MFKVGDQIVLKEGTLRYDYRDNPNHHIHLDNMPCTVTAIETNTVRVGPEKSQGFWIEDIVLYNPQPISNRG